MTLARTFRAALVAAGILTLAAVFVAARAAAADEAQALSVLEGARFAGPMALTHAGVGTPPERGDGAQAAADSAMAALRHGAPAVDAAIAGTVEMEDDPRYNAGTGANIRLDGKTIQMDASLMTSEGRFAAVAVIERVRNPIRVVRAVLDTPHLLLAGEGATRFAHRMGFADVVPTCPEAEAKYAQRLARVREALGRPGSGEFDWPSHWNFPNPLPETLRDLTHDGDTVGTVTRDAEGRYAATLSTGGTSITLYGRVGDVPVYGAGLFAGPDGAVACTGQGEDIIKQATARSVYASLSQGTSARAAVERAVRAFPASSDLGVIALGRDGWAVAANRPMAFGLAGPDRGQQTRAK